MQLDGRAELLAKEGEFFRARTFNERKRCKYGHSLTDPRNVYRRTGSDDHKECKRCRADAEERRRVRLREKYGKHWYTMTAAQRRDLDSL